MLSGLGGPGLGASHGARAGGTRAAVGSVPGSGPWPYKEPSRYKAALSGPCFPCVLKFTGLFVWVCATGAFHPRGVCKRPSVLLNGRKEVERREKHLLNISAGLCQITFWDSFLF